jgi:hypothetical protein
LGAAGLADQLAAARAGALVGREPERAVLDLMLSGAAHAPLVAYLHGPGGIGKSSLVRYAARQAELAGRRVVHVDARFLDADPRRLEEAAAPACAEPGAVLLIDTFEQCQPLEAWLRENFLPRLADHAIVVVASRVAPDAEWSLDPGWAQLFTALAVRPFNAAQSHALLAARGCPRRAARRLRRLRRRQPARPLTGRLRTPSRTRCAVEAGRRRPDDPGRTARG